MILTAVLLGMAAQTAALSEETHHQWQQWQRCIATPAGPRADSRRPVEAVVDEAMIRCDSDERATGRLAVRDSGSRGAYYIRGFRHQMRLDAIRAIAARRARPAS